MPRIAVIPGDGIGPEVARVGVKLLTRLSDLRGLGLQFDWFEFGAERRRGAREGAPFH